ncbi:TetR/AcrR family transcriptional regulator [Gorillibacterium sp. CAU 1737]|uniref:TetR/AcrR family transcriptional regulator n=1 Tax=Gorillibacterium sp. CAU 1737 TaxID=3140362 RepID=UPI00326145F6
MAGPKGEATRARLVASAETLFAAKGYHAATVSQIVSGAGVTQASFYLHFASKEELLTELLDRFEQKLAALGDAGKEAPHHLDRSLEEFSAGALAQVFSLLGENANLTRIALQGPSGERLRTILAKQVEVNLRGNQARGIVHEEIDPEIVAYSLVAAVEQLTYGYLLSGERSKEELSRQVARMFLSGVLPKEGEKS